MRWSSQIHTGFLGSRDTREHQSKGYTFHIRDHYPLRCDFPDTSAMYNFCNFVNSQVPILLSPTTPIMHRHQAVSHYEFRLIPLRSPLLRESRLLSFPWGTEMFQFAQFPLPHLWPFGFQCGITTVKRN